MATRRQDSRLTSAEFLVGSTLIIVGAVVWYLGWAHGRTLVKVTNGGTAALSGVTIGTGDEKIRLRDLAPGETAIARFKPKGESGAELEAHRANGGIVRGASYVEDGHGYRVHYVVTDSSQAAGRVSILGSWPR